MSSLPPELVLCVFIHGFVLPFPKWVKQGILGRSNPPPKEDKRSLPLPALLPISPLVIASHFAPPLTPTPTANATNTKTLTTTTTNTTNIITDCYDTNSDLTLAPPNSFKGTDGTFCGFPERLKHVLNETLQGTKVECVVFPSYETRGDLAEATARFVSWLTELTVNLESSHNLRAGGAKVVLCGHSMGGLLAADALLGIAGVEMGDDKKPKDGKEGPEGEGEAESKDADRQGKMIWPRIVACIGYDTPYLGLHPNVFKHSMNQMNTYIDAAKAVASEFGLFGLAASPVPTSATGASPQAQAQAQASGQVQNMPERNQKGKDQDPEQKREASRPPPTPNPKPLDTSSWTKQLSSLSISPTYVAAAAGTLLAGAAAGTAYYKRQDLAGGWQWASEHLQYVGNLWDEKGLKRRLELVISTGVVFRDFYTLLPASALHPTERTFSILPPSSSPSHPHFVPQTNKVAKDEIEAHIGMFEPKSNDGYYEMGLEVVRVIGEAVTLARQRDISPGGANSADRRREQKGRTAGETEVADLINLDSPPPSTQYHSAPSTPSSYPSSARTPTSANLYGNIPVLSPNFSTGLTGSTTTPISAVPSSTQLSDLPWSARTPVTTDSAIKRIEERERKAWEGVPVEGLAREEPEEEGKEEEGGGGEGGDVWLDAGAVEIDNPWSGRLRKVHRKKHLSSTAG